MTAVGMPDEHRETAVLVWLDAEKPSLGVAGIDRPPTHAGRGWIHREPVERDELAPGEHSEIIMPALVPVATTSCGTSGLKNGENANVP